MKIHRIFSCAVALVFSFLLASSAYAALDKTITVRLGHFMAPGHFEHKHWLKLADDLAKRSDGKIILKVFPAGQLGSPREQIEQVNLGALEITSSGSNIQAYAPQLGVWALPFIFRGPEHFTKVMSGQIGEELRQLALERSNIRILEYLPIGERVFFTNKKPFRRLEDFQGIKIRVDDQPISAKIWQAIGANAVPLPYGELYTSLKSGIVDAAENPPANIIKLKFYEAGKYITVTRHSMTLHAMQANEKWWQGLPDEARQIFTDAIKAWIPGRRQAAWDADKAAFKELERLGAVVTPLEDPEKFQERLFPLYKEFGEKTGSMEIIEKIRATK